MSELSSAIRAVCEEKELSYDSVLETIELSLAAAYRKDYGQKNQNIKVKFNPETGETKIMDVKTVVEDLPEEEIEEAGEAEEEKEEKKPKKKEKKKKEETKKEDEKDEEEKERKFNPKTEIQLTDAKLIKKDAKIGDEIVTEMEAPGSYGRMAAQTAKQVIIQKLREAEREMIYNEFKGKEHEVVTGVVQRREGRNILIDLGKTVGRLPMEEQIMGEKYNPGEKIKVYIKEIRAGSKGPEIILSRTSEEILRKIFYLEIPEISNGLLEIKVVAREAGNRSKVAIWTDAENVDPIGSCVGQRGSRIQTIISELGGERVDMVEYDEDPAKFISNALSPAKVLAVDIDEKERTAIVKVLPEQLSLAIGKKGQNVRLAARLTGWKIDIMEEGDGTSVKLTAKDTEETDEKGKKDKKETKVKKEEEDKKEKEETKKEDEKDEEEKEKKTKKKEKKEKKEKPAKDKNKETKKKEIKEEKEKKDDKKEEKDSKK